VTSLADLAARLGRLRCVELRLFEVMGNWVASTPEPPAKLLLAEQCYHHAWHAQLWVEHFPQGYGHDVAQATAAGADQVSGWLDELAGLERTVARLAGLHRVVVPRLAVAYRRWLEEADLVADGPLLRWLQFASADETADWQRGEQLLQHLLVNQESVDAAAAAQVRVESVMVAHGGLWGHRPSSERRSSGNAPQGGSS